MPRQKAVIAREVRIIRTTFNRLARSFGRIAPLLAAQPGPNGRRKLSAEQRKAMKLQGKYMGTMRGLKPRQRATVKQVRVEKGIRAAIAAARRLAI